ncbi:MAG: translation initiation factor IF-2 N-terminal domain-containing protein, partial [Clostridiales Family XIII bacterium]|nr:translation initiation factor IF-2 N-terminal domain-containing protein [Clostridiales Family XIII bacterium]
MSIKIHELAKELDIPSKDVLAKALAMGVEAKTHMSAISDMEAITVKNAIVHGSKGVETKIVKVQPRTEKPKNAPEDAPRVVVKAAVKPAVNPALKPKPPVNGVREPAENRPMQRPPQGIPRKVTEPRTADVFRIPSEQAAEEKRPAVTQEFRHAPQGVGVRVPAEKINKAPADETPEHANQTAAAAAGTDTFAPETRSDAHPALKQAGEQPESGKRSEPLAHADRPQHPVTAGSQPARPAGDGRPPARTGDGRPPARAGDGRPPARTGDGRPPARTGDGRPPARTGDGRPPARTGDGRPPARTGDGRPPARTGDGR